MKLLIFLTHSMKYIWYSPQKRKYPLFISGIFTHIIHIQQMDQITYNKIYPISSIIRQSFSFQNNPKDLDPSCKMDLDLWDCLVRVKIGIVAKFHRTDLVI